MVSLIHSSENGTFSMHRLLVTVVCLLLAGCQLSLPGSGDDPVTTNPVTGDAIAVTPLDAPIEGLAEAEAQDVPVDDTLAEATPPDEAVVDAGADPETVPPVAVVTPEPVPEVEEVDPALQTPAALACLKQGGRYLPIGSSISRACVTPTRDGGDRCESGKTCDGECLARSLTCAPVTPLFGCNEIIQEDGRRVTLCIE
jgi:hypothetical protein